MKYLLPFKNWRIVVLTILAALTLAFAVGDCDDLVLLFITKIIAVILAYGTRALARHWDGKMPELDVYNDKEEGNVEG